LDFNTWSDAEKASPEDTDAAKSYYRKKLLESMFLELEKKKSKVSPEDICDVLMDYCSKLTAPSRQFMEEHPNTRLPNDYNTYPGKMDHTTCLAVRVGPYN
jgi:hypothetical protein